MKILLISVRSSASRGGIATWTDRFLRRSEAHDIFCDLVNTEMVGKRVEKNTAKRSMIDEIKRSRRIFDDLKKCLQSNKYDAAHLNTSCGTFGLFRDYLVAKKIKKKGIRLVVHFHCDIPFWIHNSLSHKYLGKLSSLADERLVLCENSRVYLEKNYGMSSYKIPNFIDESCILGENKNISDELTSVIFVRKVTEAKGAKEIFELARRLPNISFKLVGDIVDGMADTAQTENIKFLGGMPHEEVLAQLDSADVFLFPSHSEGFSLALTEAMARGLPSIATNVGANEDMLEGGCGIITDIGDVDAMEKALHSLQNAEKRRQMSQNAVEKVKKEYSADVILEIFKEYYRS